MNRSQRGRWFASLSPLLLLTGCSSLPLSQTLLSTTASTQTAVGDASNASALKVSAELSPKEAAEACFATAKELHAHGHAKEAIILFERARELNPRETRADRYLAVLYDHEGNDARALAEFQKALKTSPKDAELLNDLGYFYYRRYSPWLVNKTPTLHWGQATMLSALAGLYRLL